MQTSELDKSIHNGPPLPAWVVSVVLHVALVLVLGVMLRSVPQGAASETSRTGGIVLAKATEKGEIYEGPADRPAPYDSNDQSTPEAINNALADASETGLNPADALPQPESLVGSALLQRGGAPSAGELTTGGGGQPRSIAGGKASVRVFGVGGEGSKFLYVFDRSSSMVGPRIESAKRELLESLKSLGPTHQFQIIFFNTELEIFDLSGGLNRIPFADDRTKSLAERYVRGIRAYGSTDRHVALLAALQMRPDVIFFLTDADNPLTTSELSNIRARNFSASINVIEFGQRGRTETSLSLDQLARQNGGQFTHIDSGSIR